MSIVESLRTHTRGFRTRSLAVAAEFLNGAFQAEKALRETGCKFGERIEIDGRDLLIDYEPSLWPLNVTSNERDYERFVCLADAVRQGREILVREGKSLKEVNTITQGRINAVARTIRLSEIEQ